MTEEQKIKHLVWRTGFGPEPAAWKASKGRPLKEIVDSLFVASAQVTPLHVVEDFMDHGAYKPKMATRKERKEKRVELQEMDRELIVAWLKKMVHDPGQLREKMTFFWSNHFCTRNLFPDYIQRMNNTLRRNALGNFRTLLLEASQERAMIQTFGLSRNVKAHPNENFARELMELFTVGRGNYTETDIRESARAFTGWQPGISKESLSKRKTHDGGIKTFMGRKGNFTGHDIIDILLEKKETATFISRKVYKAFVNDSIPDERNIGELAETFYASGYDIAALMRKLVSSDWFYDDRHAGAHIKSPVELIAGLQRAFGVTFNSQSVLIKAHRVMGQLPFSPPNVAGWPGGRSWIDSSSLLFRLNLASNILNSGTIDLDGKEDEAEDAVAPRQMGEGKEAVDKRFNTTMDWAAFSAYFQNVPGERLKGELTEFLLSVPLDNMKREAVFDSNDTSIKSISMKLVSLPEYQVC